MAISRNVGNSIVGEWFGGVNSTPPATWYLGLCVNEPGMDGVISGEPTVIGYSRIQIPNNQTSFTAPTYSDERPVAFVSNAIRLEMTEILNTGGPTVSYFFLSNAASGGSAYAWGKFDYDRELVINSVMTFEPNSLTFEIINIEDIE